jgi:hypothetical protein
MRVGSLLKIQFLKAGLILIGILSSQLHSCTLSAQGIKEFARKYHVGLEASFGVKAFDISSNVDKIDGLNVMEEGGALGLVVGGKVTRLRVRQGFYYSSASVAQTIDEVRSAVNFNVYPLELFLDNARLLPYFTIGMERNLFKMYGFYGNETSSAKPNYSLSEAPFLGKVTTIQASVGAGLEYRVRIPRHFVNFFGEAHYGKSVKTTSSAALFNATRLSDQMAITIGICYGYSR